MIPEKEMRYLDSLVRGVYNRAPFAAEQDVDLAGQVGAERYELGPDGFPTASSLVPGSTG